ncbi:MAG: 1,4-dihydroxy-2-naphthoate octaprenyltransferase [Candidatus Thalassarchaeaceae archaeon]|jgi:1,4-dihydroxy-2-naphthoate octaprenyltransferase
MAIGEGIDDEVSQNQIGDEHSISPDNETLFIMDSIIQRLKPKDSHHVKEMINQRGLASGALLMTSLLFWWISIKKGGDQVNDSNIPVSMIGQFEFETLSIVVAIIIFMATLVMIMGREKGNATISNLGGLLIVLGIFYILEPLILNFEELGAESAIFASGRLFGLATMIFLSSKFFFDALLLQWVSSSMVNMGIDVLSKNNYEDNTGPNEEENSY